MNHQLPLHGVAVYNPGLLNDEELKAYFVARHHLLEQLLSELRRETPDSAPQHRIIIGTRGMGKTTLLRRLALGVREDEVLQQQWLPLNFPEEQYNIARLSDFWVNCLDALGDTLEQMGEEVLCEELDNWVDQLPDAEEERARVALEGLINLSKRLDRRLALFIDNIDIVLERLKESHWSIREVLGHQPRLLLIGASAHMLEESYHYDAAFYDFFKLHELKGLSSEEMTQVLTRLADAEQNDKVSKLIEEQPARLQVLHTLTGGNPRTTVLLYSVLSRGIDGDVRSDLERLLDLCTPLYKARFEELPAQAQKVVDAMAVHWDPLAAGQLAEQARLPVNTVSTQLTRLEQQGVVEKVPLKPGRKTGFQIAERFFNIWYLMRTSRRVRRRLTWLVQFLKVFYSQEELRSHALTHLNGGALPHRDRIRHAEYCFSLAQATEDTSLRGALESSALHAMLSDDKLREKMGQLFDLEGEDAELKPKAERMRFMQELPQRVKEIDRDWPEGITAEEFAELLARDLVLGVSTKEMIVELLPVLSEDQLKDTITTLNKSTKYFSKIFLGHQPLLDALHQSVQIGLMGTYDQIEEAKTAAHTLNKPILFAFSDLYHLEKEPMDFSIEELDHLRKKIIEFGLDYGWNILGVALYEHGDRSKAANAFNQLLKIYPKHEDCWDNFSDILYEQGDLEGAIDACRHVLSINPDNERAWNNLGAALSRQGNLTEAINAYHRHLEINPQDEVTWNNLGIALSGQGNFEEAIKAFRRQVEVKPDHDSAWHILGLTLEEQGNIAEAIDAYRSGVQIESDGRSANALAWLFYHLGENLAEAQQLAKRALEQSPNDPSYLHTYATLLAHNGNWSEAVKQAESYITLGDEEFHEATWDDTLQFFHEAVRTDHADDAAKLLEDIDYAERWRPLHAALKAIAEGRDWLTRVAPEVRSPAEVLIERLLEGSSAA